MIIYLFLLNRGAKVRIFLCRCTTFYCSMPVVYTYLGIILEASMIFICRCLHMVTLWENNDDAKVNRVDVGELPPSTSHCTVRTGLVYGAT